MTLVMLLCGHVRRWLGKPKEEKKSRLPSFLGAFYGVSVMSGPTIKRNVWPGELCGVETKS